MSKKLVLVLAAMFFCSGLGVAHAEVIINEVKYSPTSAQWVEIYNDTDADIDITAYKILDSSVKTGHAISAQDGGSNMILKHGYGLIAKVPGDFSGSSFPVFKSSLNIKVGADTVALKNASGDIVSSVGIDGSAIGGNSFQLIDGSWRASLPTPGEVNALSEIGNTDDTTASDDGSTDTGTDDAGNDTSGTSTSGTKSSTSSKNSPAALKKVPAEQKIKAQITANTLAYVGIPFTFAGAVFGHQGEQLSDGRYFWNFGDGSSREVETIKADRFTHTYFYPGEYDVVFEHYPDTITDVPDASTHMTLKVVPDTVSISSVGDDKDFFVELSNDTDHLADVSNWMLASDYHSFRIPRDTVIASKKKMTISSRLSGFSVLDKSGLKLMTSEGDTAFSYAQASTVISVALAASSKNVATPVAVSHNKVSVNTNEKSENKQTAGNKQIPTEDTLASAVQSGSAGEDTSAYSSVFIPVASIAFVGASASTVYFVRRKKAVPEAGGDFEMESE